MWLWPLSACFCCCFYCCCCQSPEKFQRILAELTAAVDAERNQVEEVDRACSELATRQDMVGKVRHALIRLLLQHGFLLLLAAVSQSGMQYTLLQQ
jgi:hypothetical protein